jgi:hypothetical protein
MIMDTILLLASMLEDQCGHMTPLLESGMSVRYKIEPSLCYVESHCRPDLLVVDPLSGNNIKLEISLAHSWALDVASKATKEDGEACIK